MSKRSVLIFMAVAAIACACGTGSKDGKAEKDASGKDIHVCAFVWPSCHDDSLAHQWLWEEGIGEWEVIKKGDRRFPGHYQPRQPLWGYEMDDDPVVVERWINTALEHGINTFIYDWYWYTKDDEYSGPYLESALDNGFLKAPSCRKMDFYIMWANHYVKYNYWNYHKWGNNEDILFNPEVDWDKFRKIVARVIKLYFHQPNYVRIDGCPVFGIFSIEALINGFGSSEEARKALDYFRDEVRKAGFPGLHIQQIQGGGHLMSEQQIAAFNKRNKDLGIDSQALYNMGGFDPDYLVHGANAIKIREQMDQALDVPVFPCVSIGWDDTPRFPAKGEKDATRFHNTPEAFGNFLNVAKEYVDAHPDQPRFLMINAWNEWVEGSYLLPDRLNGFGYLEAVREVMNETDVKARR